MTKNCKFCNRLFLPGYKKQIFCSLKCANRFNLNNKNKINLPLEPTQELAELFSILLGDGSVTRYYTKIYLNPIADAGYSIFVKNLCKLIFPEIVVSRYPMTHRGTEDLQLSSTDVSSFLIKLGFNPKTRAVPQWIKNNNNFTKAAIRGLIDTEGCMGIKYFRGVRGNYFYKQLTFTNRSKNLLTFVETGLRRFGYKPTKPTKKFNKNIYVSNAADISRYFKEIGSHNPKLIKKYEMITIGEFRYGGLAER